METTVADAFLRQGRTGQQHQGRRDEGEDGCGDQPQQAEPDSTVVGEERPVESRHERHEAPRQQQGTWRGFADHQGIAEPRFRQPAHGVRTHAPDAQSRVSASERGQHGEERDLHELHVAMPMLQP